MLAEQIESVNAPESLDNIVYLSDYKINWEEVNNEIMSFTKEIRQCTIDAKYAVGELYDLITRSK